MALPDCLHRAGVLPGVEKTNQTAQAFSTMDGRFGRTAGYTLVVVFSIHPEIQRIDRRVDAIHLPAFQCAY